MAPRCSAGMRRSVTVLLATVCTLAAATATPAKEGVVARMLTPIPREAPPRTNVTVVWTLQSVEEGRRVTFGAGGVFIRLFGPGIARTPRAFASELEPGRYRALPRIPRGGVRRVVIGVMGTRCAANGCRSAPIIFRVVGPVFR